MWEVAVAPPDQCEMALPRRTVRFQTNSCSPSRSDRAVDFLVGRRGLQRAVVSPLQTHAKLRTPRCSRWTSLVRCANGLPTSERLDDEHHRAAVNAHEGRTDLVGRTAPNLLGQCAWCLGREQLARLVNALPPLGVGQQSVVPDAVEPAGQD